MKNQPTLKEILSELATEISSNQHELHTDGMNFTDARLADDEAIAKAAQQLETYITEQVRLGRIDELLDADDEVRLHGKIDMHYQQWFIKRLAELQAPSTSKETDKEVK